MTIDLTDTTTGAIHDALTQARRRMGGPASGMVLTLIIVTDEAEQYDAVRAASHAGREHPSRILAVITRKPKSESRLDAEIKVGETGPGETILLRMYGPLGQPDRGPDRGLARAKAGHRGPARRVRRPRD